MTGNIDTNIELKAKLVIEEITHSDMVLVHFKAPDLNGHDNEPLEKALAVQ
ncbi:MULTISPECIES: conserved domain protein [Paenibacillus]|uniref:conserved domain protein n=1 Tax=Paenibacillus TaxID=44249 RepID=UPI00020D75B0|nr:MULTISPECIES: conserved domain protein [Paenibacillus]EGL17450.1 hypothetical protein HMPREF9413_1771 [Paenibacillus sp. HGF7]EPD81796.1 hypothetical protein HMPREF1207_05554 [Paenibacillus sp. HGH0039]